MVQQLIAPLTRRSSQSAGVVLRHADCVRGGESRADGTQYIDELVMVRVKDKGDLYVHQDANWNVVGLTDLGGRRCALTAKRAQDPNATPSPPSQHNSSKPAQQRLHAIPRPDRIGFQLITRGRF